MNERKVTLPTIALIAGTRVALGIGIGLLLADRLSPEQRRAAGLALMAIGGLTTIPLVAEVFGGNRQGISQKPVVERNAIIPLVTAGGML